MHKKLFIFGNGFDLAHGLPTKYYDSAQRKEKTSQSPFRDFAEFFENNDKYPDVYEAFYLHACGGKIATSQMWAKFEDLFKNVNSKDIVLHLVKEDEELDGNDENNEISNHFGSIEAHISALKGTIDNQLTRLISNALCDWILSLDYEDVNRNIVDKFSLKLRDADCLTFNYSHTLEKFYEKNNLNILHIHGKAEPYNEHSNLIFGHGDDSDSDINIDESLGLYREIVAQSVLDEDGIDSKVLLRKKTEELLPKLREILSNAPNYEKVYIIGHSFGKVDQPYFNEIAKNLSTNTKIIISHYKEIELEFLKSSTSEIFKSLDYVFGDLSINDAKDKKSFWYLYNNV